MKNRHSKRIACDLLSSINEDDLRLLVALLSSDNIIDGKDIESFEKMFCDYLGAKYCFSFGKGRVALYAILKALDVGSNDEIILPPYTCFVVPKAVCTTGARPVYVDIDLSTFNMDVSRVKDKITTHTKVIVPHHLFGHPADMKPLLEEAKGMNLFVVEDCAQALGAEYYGKKVGILGDAAFFSFDFSKNITTGHGGMAVTNSPEIAEKLREIRDSFSPPSHAYVYSILLKLIRSTYLLEPSASLVKALIGEIVNKSMIAALDFRNLTHDKAASKMPSAHFFSLANAFAKIGVYQLSKLDRLNERRKEIAKTYDELLLNSGFPPVRVSPNVDHVFLRYCLSVKNRSEVSAAFKRFGIVVGNWFDYVVHPYSAQRETLGYKVGACPNAETAAKTIVNIPNHPKMSNDDVEQVLDALRFHCKTTPY